MQKREQGEGCIKQEMVLADLGPPITLGRRSFLRGALAGVASAVISAGCSDSSPRRVDQEPAQVPAQPTSTGSKVLLAYFSRAGENYYYGGRTNLTVGNTEVLAGMISQLIGATSIASNPLILIPTTTRRLSSGTSGNRTPMPARPSPTRWPRSSYTTLCCWEVRSGTSERP
jgi:hypothetical protein